MDLLDIKDTDCNRLINNMNLFNKKFYYKEPDSIYEIISISLQEVKDINEFKQIIDVYRVLFPNTYIRIYTNKKYDQQEFINEYKNKKFMQIIEYDYILFGKKYINSLIKYEPLFNFEEGINIKFVYIPNPNNSKININGYNKFKESNTDFYFITTNNNYLSNSLYSYKDFSLTWCRINNFGIMSKIKFPCFIYNNYIEMLSNTLHIDDQFTVNNITQMYNEYLEIQKNNDVKDKYDEILLYVLINYITLLKINFSYYYLPYYSNILTFLKKNKCPKLKSIIKCILQNNYEEEKDTKENLDIAYQTFRNHDNKNYFKYVNNFIFFAKKQLENDTYEDFCLTKDFVTSILMTLYISLKPKKFIISDERTLYSFAIL